jgi:PTH1 family peptidyl-tRNA hydrolase
VVELLADRHGGSLGKSRQAALTVEVRLGEARLALALPQTFMNESGRSVSALVRRYGISELSQLLVVHDDLDLDVGRMKVKLGGGLAGHNGLKSIRDHLHSTDFGRVRIGVGKPPGTQSGADYVLRRPGKAERTELDVVVAEAADAVEAIVGDGYDAAMNRFNR